MIRLPMARYLHLLTQDLAWLQAQPGTPEREHIEQVLQWSLEELYHATPGLTVYADGTRVRHLEVWIEGVRKTQNALRTKLRTRIQHQATDVNAGYLCTIKAMREVRPEIQPFIGRARIWRTVYRTRLIDPINVEGSLKSLMDGVVKAALPLGDGPHTPYVWMPPIQCRADHRGEGVHIVIEGE